MKLLVTGGRHYGNNDGEAETLGRMLGLLLRAGDTLIEGGGDGADTLAYEWWRRIGQHRGVKLLEFWIESERGQFRDRRDHRSARFIRCGHWSEGKWMGPRRSKRMVDEGCPDLALAFPGGDGTARCVEYARSAGVTVLQVVRRATASIVFPGWPARRD